MIYIFLELVKSFIKWFFDDSDVQTYQKYRSKLL